MSGIGIIIDNVISARNAHIDHVVRTRHISYKVRWCLAGLSFNG